MEWEVYIQFVKLFFFVTIFEGLLRLQRQLLELQQQLLPQLQPQLVPRGLR